MINKTSILLLFSLLTVHYYASGQFQFETYALHQVNLIDVKQKQIIENQTIVITKDKIVGIYDSNKFIKSDSIQLLNFKDHYAIPGLIDAHVHLGTDPLEETKKRLNHLLLNGVTTVRDMAGDARILNYLSRQASLDEIPSPDIYFSALFAGESFFKDPRTKAAAQGMLAGNASWMHSVNMSTDLNRLIAEAKGTGATGIKVYADLDENNILRIVQAAHAQQMKVWAHSTVFPARPSQVCRTGVDVISHATYLAWEGEKEIPINAVNRHRKHSQFNAADAVYLELMKIMKKNQTILDATIAIYKRSFPDSTLYRYGVSLTKLAYGNNVKIGIGTDITIDLTTVAPIFSEMIALQEDVGMKPIDIIQAATIINAEMIGQENSIGSLNVGKKANLLIVSNNPTEDISNLKKPKMVIKNGKLFQSN